MALSLKTELCELLGIEHPIIQGAMILIANAELAAAVSNAGGLGVLSFNAAGRDPEALRAELRKTKSLTGKPFGVNFPVDEDIIITYMQVAMEEGVAVATTSAGRPIVYTGLLKDAGMKVMHVVGAVRHAISAEQAGVDAIIAEGYEAGGHNAPDELTTMALVPQVVDAVQIPVVAAGGIADGRGLVAALALGAQGVQIGTRFIATPECGAHPAYKEAILQAQDNATTTHGRRLRLLARSLRNQMTAGVLELEARGASVDELIAYIGPGRAYRALLEGDVTEGEAFCGQIAGLVREMMPAGDVVRSIIAQAEAILAP